MNSKMCKALRRIVRSSVKPQDIQRRYMPRQQQGPIKLDPMCARSIYQDMKKKVNQRFRNQG